MSGKGLWKWTVSDLDCVYEFVCLYLQAVLSHGSELTAKDLDTSLSRAQNMGQLYDLKFISQYSLYHSCMIYWL